MSAVPGNLDAQTLLDSSEDVHVPARNAPAIEVRPYDFRRPGKALADMTSLDPLHAAFAVKLSKTLSDQFRIGIDVVVLLIEQLTYDEFVSSLGEMTCMGILRVDPPGAQGCLDLSLPVIYPMIDRLLGGGADGFLPPPIRPLTQIEQALALQIVERAAGVLSDAWNSVAPTEVREESIESSPTAVRIMPGEEGVTVVRFDVRFPGGGGMMSLCLPVPVIAQLQLTGQPTDQPVSASDPLADRENLTRHLLDAAVELRVLLAETKLRLSDVLTMQPGDVITTETPSNQEVLVQVEGKRKFQACPGHLRGTRAVRITSVPRIDDACGGETP